MKRLIISVLILTSNFLYSQDFLGEYNLHGKVRSGQTAQGLPGVEVKYKQLTPTVDSIITYTNEYGEYNFSITDVKETGTAQSSAVIKYYNNNIDLPKDGLLTVWNILGQKIFNQKLNKGVNNIKLDRYATGIYITDIDIDGIHTQNKILKLNGTQSYFGTGYGYLTAKPNRLNKISDITYVLEFRDTTGQYYLYLVLDTKTLTENQIYNTPLLPKGLLAVPFTDPDNGHYIDDNRKLLLDLVGAFWLPAVAYKTTIKPLKTHLDLEDLPVQYNINDVREATLEMIAETLLPIDSIYEETSEYLDPDWITESSVGYQYLDNGSMQGYDLIITNIIGNQTLKKSYIFKFNRETIEPEYLKQFIKLAWFGGITGGRVQVPGYSTYDPRDTDTTMNEAEQVVFRTDFQWSDKPTWLSIYNFPEDNGPFNRLNIKTEFMNEKTQSFEIGFKREGDSYKQVLITK